VYTLNFCQELFATPYDGNANNFPWTTLFGYIDTFQATGDGSFSQTYTWGDRGEPCNSWRNASVNLLCGDCPSGSQFKCDDAYCVCDASFDACHVDMTVKWSCPSPRSLADPLPDEPYSLLGIFALFFLILVVLLVIVAACGAGAIYNMKVLGKTGTAIIPGYSQSLELFNSSMTMFRRNAPSSSSTTALGNDESDAQGAYQSAGYGTVGE
jgi:hypothetical protein